MAACETLSSVTFVAMRFRRTAFSRRVAQIHKGTGARHLAEAVLQGPPARAQADTELLDAQGLLAILGQGDVLAFPDDRHRDSTRRPLPRCGIPAREHVQNGLHEVGGLLRGPRDVLGTEPTAKRIERGRFRPDHGRGQGAANLRGSRRSIQEFRKRFVAERDRQQLHAGRPLDLEILSATKNEDMAGVEFPALHAHRAGWVAAEQCEAHLPAGQAALLHHPFAHPLAKHVHAARRPLVQGAAHGPGGHLQVSLVPLGRRSAADVEVLEYERVEVHGTFVLPIRDSGAHAGRRRLDAMQTRSTRQERAPLSGPLTFASVLVCAALAAILAAGCTGTGRMNQKGAATMSLELLLHRAGHGPTRSTRRRTNRDTATGSEPSSAPAISAPQW
jgi:hypothetical protein